MTAPNELWRPSEERVAEANLTRFADWLDRPGGMDALHRWSVADPPAFWSALWDFTQVRASRPPERVLDDPGRMPGARWFEGARLNFAENLLRSTGLPGGDPLDDETEALVSWNEEGRVRALTRRELRDEVARFAAALRGVGVGPGDRVAAILPNTVEAVVGMLATSSLGAIWSSCSPDFGAEAALDRFGQIAPRVLICAPAALWNGSWKSGVDRVGELCAGLPTVEVVVVAEYGSAAVDDPVGRIRAAVLEAASATPSTEAHPEGGVHAWADFARTDEPAPPLDFAQLPFDHPVYILYSSGTTGLPKCLVHGQGGTLLQHLKELVLHTDVGAGDRVFYYTTCGWMMWNWVVSALATGATVLLYDGSPLPEREARMWEMVEEERITVFGTSAKYLALAEKRGMTPRTAHDLSSLRTILSTGSPLMPANFDWVYREVKGDVHLASISGGTDIVSCFMLGDPTGPVHRGQLQCAGLGMKVEVWDADGRPLPAGQVGELVCTLPFPSMPIGFWNDPDGARYREAYFTHFSPGPSVWRHGDWVERTVEGGFVVHGRSDTTLNPGGVRIGTAEIYRQVDRLPEVVESVVVGQDQDGDQRVVLFVVLAGDAELSPELEARIRHRIRTHTTPRHVPAVIRQVPDIPRTISGKMSETAVHRMVHDRSVENRSTLANPEALVHFRAGFD